MIFPAWTWVLIPIALVLCVSGFYKLSYLSTLARGLCLAGLSLAVLILSFAVGHVSLVLGLLCLLALICGLRRDGLAAYAVLRSAARRKYMKSQSETEMGPMLLLVQWLGFALIYVLEIFPLWYRASAEKAGNLGGWIGLVLMLAGFVLEEAADRQQIAAANENPYLPAMSGLYRLVRCPGALGECLFRTGLFISGIDAYQGLQWLPAVLAWAVSLFFVWQRLKREERRAEKNFGDLPVYREYVRSTPLILPFVPLYSVDRKEND